MIDVGPNFSEGQRRIGRERLRYGLVAILGDPELFAAAMAELHGYAMAGAASDKPRRGIVFRQVTPGERQAIHYKLQELLGVGDFAANAEVFDVASARWHSIDDDHIAHVMNRHGRAGEERLRGQVEVTLDDLIEIPAVLDPRNITEFSVVGGMPRIVYRRAFAAHDLVVVEEIRSRDGLAVKTLYKPKK